MNMAMALRWDICKMNGSSYKITAYQLIRFNLITKTILLYSFLNLFFIFLRKIWSASNLVIDVSFLKKSYLGIISKSV